MERGKPWTTKWHRELRLTKQSTQTAQEEELKRRTQELITRIVEKATDLRRLGVRLQRTVFHLLQEETSQHS